MSLTTYLKQRLGISYKEASLVESQVKEFSTSLIEKKKMGSNKNLSIKESFKKRKFKEEEEMPMESDEEMSMDMEEPTMDEMGMESPMEDIDASDELMVGNGMYTDNEVEMIKIQLKSIINHSESLLNSLESEENIDAWIQSKITLAQDYINSVHDYMVYSDTYGEEGMESEEVESEPMEEPMEMEELVGEPAMEEEKPAPVQESYDKIFKTGFIAF